jgi:deoxyribonuclease V
MVGARLSYETPETIDEAIALQQRLASLVETTNRIPDLIERVGGADVAYETGGERLFAATVIVDANTSAPLETSTHEDLARFPYVPGLFSFREFPPLAEALSKLAQAPDLLICDGQGLAHPRRFGLACHVGVVFDIPTIGCAKSRLIGEYDEPGDKRGDYSMLWHQGETIGAVLRTRDRTKPVFVSVGHRISLVTACEWILRLASKYRQPEPIRQANALANQLRDANLLRDKPE